MSETAPEFRRLTATLTGLRVTGFKSFAEPVQVPVLPGLTGIVGPNGCGKSNVVEALRWAMGESSARSLRGGEMDDIIFAGTATRPARNLAEVVLSLEDASGVAPAPMDQSPELEVIRRIERGSGSNYRINGREVRARDVQTMFADLASGPRASGMVSQGRVAMLIGAKPEERRSVLEEAAGIAGLRARRHEAELKLRQAEANLARAEDLLAQLGVQQEALRKQARQAARYRNLSGLVRDAEGEWFAILVARAEDAIEAARETLAGRAQALAHAEAAADEAGRLAEAAQAGIEAPRAEEGVARTLLERRRVEAENVAGEADRAGAALAAAEAMLAQLLADLADAAAVEADARAAETRAGQEAAGLASAEALLPGRIEAAAKDAAALDAEVAAAEARTEVATEAAAALAARANQLAAELASADQRVMRLAGQMAQFIAQRGAAEAQAVPSAALESAAAAITHAGSALDEARAGLEAAEHRRVEAERAANAARDAARAASLERLAAERAQDAAAQRLKAAGAREAAAARNRPPSEATTLADARSAVTATHSALRTAETTLGDARAAATAAHAAATAARAAEAAAQSAEARLEAELQGLRAAADTPGEAAPIARTLTIPEGLEAAIGAALGEGLEGGRGAGASRFWRALPPLDAPPPLPVGATPLADLVGAPPELGRALSQIGLVEDGADLQGRLRPGQALVARSGALWRWDGYGQAPGMAGAGAARLQTLARMRQAQSRLAVAAPAARAAEAARVTAAQNEACARSTEEDARVARNAAEPAHARALAEAARREAAARRMAEHAAQAALLAEERMDAEALLQAADTLLAATPVATAFQPEADAARAAQSHEAAKRDARRGAEGVLASAHSMEAALRGRHATAAALLAALAPQEERLAGEATEAEDALAVARAARDALPDLAQARQAVDAARLELAAIRGRAAEARGRAMALQAEFGGLRQRHEAAQAERAAWTLRLADAAARLAAQQARRADAIARHAEAATLPGRVAGARAEAERRLATAERAHEAARAALNAAESHSRMRGESRRTTDAALVQAREAALRAEASRASAMQAGAAVAQRILERLGDSAELPARPDDASDAGEERARRRAERLAREREEMGPVNLRAETQLTELDARITQIMTDREEVASAIAKLRGSIGHLNREARERLRAIFDQVDREFRALFGKLFGGGRAHLALVGSEDPLEAGLEIYAEPPGKKLSALSLLSGGEQALTALSLIFAVFRCHPAPVCVLDEVDAPLDDANVERLCDLLDSMANTGTRFLIVTHHALTMARMHRLFGVTMQERGVSRLLSVDLGEAVAMVDG